MPKYYVTLSYTVTRSFTVRAKDEEAAIEKAQLLAPEKAEDTEEEYQDGEAEEVE